MKKNPLIVFFVFLMVLVFFASASFKFIPEPIIKFIKSPIFDFLFFGTMCGLFIQVLLKKKEEGKKRLILIIIWGVFIVSFVLSKIIK